MCNSMPVSRPLTARMIALRAASGFMSGVLR
jgi:hypothetical protein